MQASIMKRPVRVQYSAADLCLTSCILLDEMFASHICSWT